jgi:hypothetical protein
MEPNAVSSGVSQGYWLRALDHLYELEQIGILAAIPIVRLKKNHSLKVHGDPTASPASAGVENLVPFYLQIESQVYPLRLVGNLLHLPILQLSGPYIVDDLPKTTPSGPSAKQPLSFNASHHPNTSQTPASPPKSRQELQFSSTPLQQSELGDSVVYSPLPIGAERPRKTSTAKTSRSHNAGPYPGLPPSSNTHLAPSHINQHLPSLFAVSQITPDESLLTSD